MPKYTTGELAKQCGVTVRTVQFYDAKKLLPPTELTEGGRRLYSEADLKKLRLIGLLKALGLSLDAIRDILNSQDPNPVLLLLLEEQLKQIDTDIEKQQKQKEAIHAVQETIRSAGLIPVDSIDGIEQMMNGKRKLRKTYAALLVIGIGMDVIQICTLLLWIMRGVWWLFVAGIPVVVLLGCLLTALYYHNTAYICPQCHETFKPLFKEFLFAKHTPRTRRLTCTKCGHKGYCVETYAEKTDHPTE